MEQITGGLMERFRGKTLITQVFIIIFGVSTLLITLVCSLVAVQTREAFINNNNLIYSNTLKISSETMDALLSGYHDSLTHITYDGAIIDAVVTPDEPSSPNNYPVFSALDGYCQENEAIRRIFLYVARSGTVLTSAYEAYQAENFSDWEIIDRHRQRNSETSILKSGRTTYLEMDGDSVYIVRDFPLNGDKRLGTLFMEINPDSLYSSLRGNQTDFTSLYVYDSQWNPIFPGLLDYSSIEPQMSQLRLLLKPNASSAEFLDEHHYFLRVSNRSSIRMILTVNDLYFMPSLRSSLKNILPFLILITAMSALLSAGIIYCCYIPVLRLTKLFSIQEDNEPKGSPKKNEWDYLADRFLDISFQKEQLDSILNHMIPQISTEFYFELLNGKPMEQMYIQNILKNIDSPLEVKGSYTTIAFAFPEDGKAGEHKRLLNELRLWLEKFSQGLCHYVIQKTDDSVYTAIIQFSDNISDIQIISFEIKMEQAFFQYTQNIDDNAWMQIGPWCSCIENISVTYHATLHRLAAKKYPSLNTGTEDENGGSLLMDQRYFQFQLRSVMEYIEKEQPELAAQKALQICQQLERIEDSQERWRGCELYRLAILQILSTARITKSNIPENLVFQDDLLLKEEMKDPEKLKQCMKELALAAIRLLNEKYQKQQHKYLIQARKYIEENYMNPDLSLNLLAEQCKTTTSYLSRLFKESFGINFIEYLNQLRIQKAKSLLDTSKYSVKEAALLTGFNSQQNFIRVFKKYEGITPGQYKASATHQQESRK